MAQKKEEPRKLSKVSPRENSTGQIPLVTWKNARIGAKLEGVVKADETEFNPQLEKDMHHLIIGRVSDTVKVAVPTTLEALIANVEGEWIGRRIVIVYRGKDSLTGSHSFELFA